MHILTRYLLKQFLRSSLSIIIILSGIFMVFDVLSNAAEVIQNSNSGWQTLLHYIKLRLPGIVVLVIPIGALLGTMLTMQEMVKSKEIVVIGGAGFSIYYIAYILTLGACLLAVIQFSLNELTATDSNSRLRLWAEKSYQGSPPPTPKSYKTLWAIDEQYILHYQSKNIDGTVLYNPLYIERNLSDSSIQQTLRAHRAIYKNNTWTLNNITSGNTNLIGKNLEINFKLKPKDFLQSLQNYEETKFMNLLPLVFSAKNIKNQKTATPYHLWFQRKLAQPFSIILMVLLAVPIGLFMTRSSNGFLLSFIFIVIGFLFFISERVFLSMGESYILPTFLAVWSPHLIFGSMTIWFMIHKQE